MNGTLFLCHRIPYPPNKGDKIRSYHILKMLQQLGPVYLGAFIDDEQDREYEPHLRHQLEACYLPSLGKWGSIAGAASGLMTQQALSVPYYFRRAMQRWVDGIIGQHRPARILIYSSVMAQYVVRFKAPMTVIDFVDVDSDKWAQYAQKQSSLKSWLYRREARKLAAYEAEIAGQFDASFFVAEAEASLFRRHHPHLAAKVSHFDNGVDLEYFDPCHGFDSPYTETQNLVFTGAMDYWPNVDAVVWFVRAIWPLLKKSRPQLQFYIVGGHPSAEVQVLSQVDGVHVTGRVADVRPFLKYAVLAVAPLRVARGVQNKVLEALAMNVPVVATTAAASGLHQPWPEQMAVTDRPDEFANACERHICLSTARHTRTYVTNHYRWENNLLPLKTMMVAS